LTPATDNAPATAVLLGLECGGTRTVAIASDPDFCLLQRLEAGPCNLRLVSDAQLLQHFSEIAARIAGVAAVGVGMAGVRDAQDIARVRNILTQVWPGCPSEVDHDLESALSAANLTDDQPTHTKVILLSGTGSCCYGRAPGGGTAKVGGWGHQLGDRGSAYDIVHRALRAAAHHLDHTGHWCDFGQRALAASLLNAPNDLIAWMQGASKSEVAALAPHVFAAAGSGDRVAKRVLADTETALADDALACARKLGRHPTDFVFAGSVVLKQESFARRIATRIRKARPGSRVQALARESAWGAVVMAQRALRGVAPLPAAHQRPSAKADSATPFPIPASREMSPTERRNPASTQLDRMPVNDAINLMLAEDERLPAILRTHRPALARLIREVTKALGAGGRLFYAGAGTSGRLGVLDASECPPTFRTPPEWVQGIMAGGFRALHSAVEGAEDDASAGAAAIDNRGLTDRDVLIGIAASGRTPFVWGALHAARARGAFTALLCFNPHLERLKGGPPDLLLAIDTGPEILTGSTRLKAGTATKLVLNIVTTLSMVRLGKVVGNLMVDLNPSNVKLRDRAIRIVCELTGADRTAAQAALESSGWVLKPAIASLGRKS
jgi:N-acetylmuramic acid 6-phosphate etherase